MLVRTYLDELERLPLASLDAIAGTRPVLVIAPHQDDESLGCGGLIAALRERVQPVSVVFVTDGSGSHPNSPSHPSTRLAAVRRAEALASLAVLGVTEECVTFLDLKDAAAPLAGPAFAGAVARMADIAAAGDVGTVFCTSGYDPHCDHEAAAAMARALVSAREGLRLLFYPIWSWHRPADETCDVESPDGFRLDITPWLERKRRAVACHRSQMTDLIDDDPTGFRFDPDKLAPFLRPVETYIKASL